MAEPLPGALARVRTALLADETLVRAVASGRRRGEQPWWRRVELRYVDLQAGRHLQVTAYDDTQAHTVNHRVAADASEAVDRLLDEPFGNWHVESTTETLQLRVTRKQQALVHAGPPTQTAPDRTHDRAKERLLPEDDPVLRALGIADEQGRIKPSRQAKYRQVEEFLRALSTAIDEALASGRLRTPTVEEPLRIVDLGCGNAYLTFAAQAWLARVRGLPAHLTGVDVKAQAHAHNSALAEQLGVADRMEFVVGGIGDVRLEQHPDVVLALHACDTATDDALARALEWEADLVLAAPCCHHDISAQLRRAPTPPGYAMLTRDGILRERLADTLTDALRAAILRLSGYRVDVVEFVESQHTPRNTLLRAVRTGRGADDRARADYATLVDTWRLRPRLAELLGDRLAR
ncbi:MAG TPA: SAM-dependent methyltransferase [Marmoricola sp.]|nr:SAM-dependent methyltransferase [Marmoricola sp.]